MNNDINNIEQEGNQLVWNMPYRECGLYNKALK